VYAFDPSLETRMETAVLNRVTVKVPWEDVGPGPVGEYLEVIDFDPASGCFYEPVDLDHPFLLAQDGVDPSEGNPRYHQQMVYAVAMMTIRSFERALGRTAMWAPGGPPEDPERPVRRLRLFPHALRAANAYYSPARKAILFGYFPATATQPGRHLPRGMVFTCLSHDVISHEVTHALLDGMHRRLLEPSNPDVLAFHEAFADVVALFQHFSLAEVLRHQIARTRGDLSSENLLGQLAQQYGEATGHYGALRDALGTADPATGAWQPLKPDPTELDRVFEPHARGSILVAAVFDAFLSLYRSRTADLLRIATAGTGALPAGALHPDLVDRLAAEAAKSAEHVLTMCIRALDYCPPVDLTYGEYLRALITADFDLVRDDDRGYRTAFIEAFRRRGIYPRDVRTLSEDTLRWQPPARTFPPLAGLERMKAVANVVRRWELGRDRHDLWDEMERARGELYAWVAGLDPASARELGIDPSNVGPDAPAGVPGGPAGWDVSAVRPARRVGPDGQSLTDLVVEVTQARWVAVVAAGVPAGAGFWFRGGSTLVLDFESGRARYCIRKDVASTDREARQRAFLSGGSVPSLQSTYFGALEQGGEPFAFLHGDSDGTGDLP
jgi:hypothetical protein